LYSNAILSNPASLSSVQKQFETICRLVQLDPSSPSVLEDLRAISTKQLISAVERAGKQSTFRGVDGKDGWV
ncbi:hypothetical protein, partial [Moraxella catarrhalis]|uniref:hypothetical protein n=1 Tax=Moraxella catarrhalis TaxID=480 RepID=UPI001D0DBB82